MGGLLVLGTALGVTQVVQSIIILTLYPSFPLHHLLLNRHRIPIVLNTFLEFIMILYYVDVELVLVQLVEILVGLARIIRLILKRRLQLIEFPCFFHAHVLSILQVSCSLC